MKLSLLNSSETVQMSMSGGEAVSLSLKTGAVQTGGSLTSAAVAVEVGNIAVLLGTI